MKKFNIPRFFGDAGAFSTSKSVTFVGSNFEMEVNKNGYECRPVTPKWYNNTYIRIFILAIFEIIFYITTKRSIYNNWFMSLSFLALFILSLCIYGYIFNNFKNLRMNHGAEHKVINAFINHDLENVDKYSRFSDDCGSNIYSVFVILLAISPIIRFPVTIFLIFMIIYNDLRPVRMATFNTIGKFVQKFTTAEPTEEILKSTKVGFEKLIYFEVEKVIKDSIVDASLKYGPEKREGV